MLAIKIQEAMKRYKRLTGEKMTYKILSERTGIGASTLGSMGSRLGYSTSTSNIEKLCIALDITPGELLEVLPDTPRNPRRKKKVTKRISRKTVAKKR